MQTCAARALLDHAAQRVISGRGRVHRDGLVERVQLSVAGVLLSWLPLAS